MRILLIGYGSAGRRHEELLKEIDRGIYVEIIDPAISPLTRVFDFREFDAFIIASPSTTHAWWLKALIPYNKPILVEKPAVMNVIEWEEVQRVIDREKYTAWIVVGYQLRFHPVVRQLRETHNAIERMDFRFGYDIRKWHANLAYKARDGILLEASHEIDLALLLSRFCWKQSPESVISSKLTMLPVYGEAECRAEAVLKVSPERTIGLKLNYTQPSYQRDVTFTMHGSGQSHSFNRRFLRDGADLRSAYYKQSLEFVRRLKLAISNQVDGSVGRGMPELCSWQESGHALHWIHVIRANASGNEP